MNFPNGFRIPEKGLRKSPAAYYRTLEEVPRPQELKQKLKNKKIEKMAKISIILSVYISSKKTRITKRSLKVIMSGGRLLSTFRNVDL